jgi:hypothetical protein
MVSFFSLEFQDLTAQFTTGACRRVHVKVPQVFLQTFLVRGFGDFDAFDLVGSRRQGENNWTGLANITRGVNVGKHFHFLTQSNVTETVTELFGPTIERGDRVTSRGRLGTRGRFLRNAQDGNEFGDDLLSFRVVDVDIVGRTGMLSLGRRDNRMGQMV